MVEDAPKPTSIQSVLCVFSGWPMGDTRFATLCVDDSGECIHQVFNNADEYKGNVTSLPSHLIYSRQTNMLLPSP